MARSYGRLMLSIWRDEEFIALSGSAQRCYFLLISQPALSHAGCLPLQPGKWAKLAANTNTETLGKALQELSERRFILVDEDTEEVLIRSFIKHDGGATNTNLGKAIVSAVNKIDSAALRKLARHEYDKASGNTQVTDPDEDPPEDPCEDGPEEASEGASEATYIPNPSPLTINPSPPTALSASADTPKLVGQEEGEFAKRKRAIAIEYARITLEQTERKNPGSIRSVEAFTNKMLAKAMDHDRIEGWMCEYPDAPSSAVAAWMTGEKHSMLHQTRVAS